MQRRNAAPRIENRFKQTTNDEQGDNTKPSDPHLDDEMPAKIAPAFLVFPEIAFEGQPTERGLAVLWRSSIDLSR